MAQVLAVRRALHVDDVELAARVLADLLHAGVRPVVVDTEPDIVLDEAIRDAADEVVLVVVGHSPDDDLCWQIATALDTAILVVPDAPGWQRRFVSRALVPLDGTIESAAAVEHVVTLLAAAGIDTLVLHVFSDATVPAMWDHPEHAEAVWRDEFAARSGASHWGPVRWRSGDAAESVVDVAADEGTDLIVLAWARNLGEGRSETVRHTVEHARVPVLLLPVSS